MANNIVEQFEEIYSRWNLLDKAGKDTLDSNYIVDLLLNINSYRKEIRNDILKKAKLCFYDMLKTY